MHSKLKKLFFARLILVGLFCKCFALQTYEFVQQDIQEIVYAVSLSENIPIICDSTVSGKATFRFAAPDFEKSFDVFLEANRLYVEKSNGVWIVSKSRIIQNAQADDISPQADKTATVETTTQADAFNGVPAQVNDTPPQVNDTPAQTYDTPAQAEPTFQIDANDIACSVLFEQFSKKTGYIIVHEVLPTMPISFHAKNVKLVEAVALIMKNFSGYSVQLDGNTIFVEKSTVQTKQIEQSGIAQIAQNEDGTFSGILENCNFYTALLSLLNYNNIQYCCMTKNTASLEKLSFENKTFENVLNLLCALCSVDYKIDDELYIFYSSTLKNQSLQEEAKSWQTYKLDYFSFQEFSSILSFRFPLIKFQMIGDYNFTCCATQTDHLEIKSFLQECDKANECFVLDFQFIKAKDFLANVPSGFSKSDFCTTGNEESLFYFGSAAKAEQLKTFVKTMDKPVQNIAYDLLIIQTQKSENENWDLNLKAAPLSSGQNYSLSASVLPTFAFNIDLISAFGLNFATSLQASIQSNKTEIFADTTLHGISGVPINFKNTNTFRYRDPYINTETGAKLQSGVTREIISGLVLDVTGYVSGDGMITTNVTASVSRRGADVSSSTGNPPPTSEKVVTTQVTGRSGEVIVLSGLLQNDSSFIEEKVPLLSKIPFIGKLFSSNTKTKENTEMYIYLVPHILSEQTCEQTCDVEI